jgi:hypothetical protein
MGLGWPAELVRVVPWAAGPVVSSTSYYIGLAVLIVIMIGVLIAAYRTWWEINDVEEPDSPADLLESFEQAHAEGELDKHELDRVRQLLSTSGEGAGRPDAEGRTRGQVVAGEGRANPGPAEPADESN